MFGITRPSIYEKILESEYTGRRDPDAGNDASSKKTEERRVEKRDDSNTGNNDANSKDKTKNTKRNFDFRIKRNIHQ